ncbi:MAG: MBL fold metallo-hydrolase [Bacteroidetes bacterium]|nr:MBL fold metallo-hydrolase [Bacteroidota bacterium]
MSLYIASLNSGSNGNSYYIGNDREAVLIDAGLSCRETERRMRKLGLQMSLVKAIFISHEHDDHIRGLEVLSRRYQIPVHITDETLGNSRLQLDAHLVRALSPDQHTAIGGLSILAFPKTHDAIDPHSFVVSTDRGDGSAIRIGIFTDLGHVCANLIQHFQSCHAAFLESNYDETLLENGRYPWPLKNRIRGGKGHLSNHQALELFVRYRPSFMSHLLLAHLSQDNNRPELVQRLFEDASKGTFVVVASRHGESEVYAIDGNYDGQAGIGATADWIDNPVRATRTAGSGAEVAPAADSSPKPAAIGHSKIRRRRSALLNRPGQPIQTTLF